MAKRTFKEILKQTKTKNARALMKKAYKANRIAKISSGNNRKKAYQIKSDALLFMAKKMRNSTKIINDKKLLNFVVIRPKGEPSGLHIPRHLLAKLNTV